MEKLDTKNMQAKGGVWVGEVFVFSVAREQPTSIHGIAKYDPSIQQGSKLSLLTGSEAGYQDGPVSDAQFKNPASVCNSKAYGLIVADMENHRVRSIQNGYVRTLVGTGMPGNQDGPFGVGQLNFPSLLGHSTEYIIISESKTPNKLRLVSCSTGILSTVNISTGDMTASLIPTCLTCFGPDFSICTPNAIYTMSIGPNTFSSNPSILLKPHLVLGNRISFNSIQHFNNGDLLFSAGSSLRILTSDAQVHLVKDLEIPSSGAVPLIAVSERNNVVIIDLATGYTYVGVYNPFASNNSVSNFVAAAPLSGKFDQGQDTQNNRWQQYPASSPLPSSTAPPSNQTQGYPPSNPWETQQPQGQATQTQNAQSSQMGYSGSGMPSDAPTFDPNAYYNGSGNRSSYNGSQGGTNPTNESTYAISQPPLTGSPAPNLNNYSSNPSPLTANPQAPAQDGGNPFGQYPSGYPPQIGSTSSTPGQSPATSRVGFDSPVQTQYGGSNQSVPPGYPPTQMPNPTLIQGPPATAMATPYQVMQSPGPVVMQGYPQTAQATTYGSPYGTPVAVGTPIIGAPIAMGTPIAVSSPVVAITSVAPVPAKHHHSSSGSKLEKPSSSGLWEWESTNDVWNPYDMNIHNAILFAYQNGQTKANFAINGIQYEIDFSNSPTRQVQTLNRSKTRRVRGPVTCPLPIVN